MMEVHAGTRYFGDVQKPRGSSRRVPASVMAGFEGNATWDV